MRTFKSPSLRHPGVNGDRRRVLKVFGATVVAGLAGCGSSSDDPTTTDGTTTSRESAESTTLSPTETLAPTTTGPSTTVGTGTAATSSETETETSTAGTTTETPTRAPTATPRPTKTATSTATPRNIDGEGAGSVGAGDGDSADQFGRAVALDGDTALVGASRDGDPNGEGAGSAYVFARSDGTWSQMAKLVADDGDGGDAFGYSVALSGDTAVVGAPRDEDPNGGKAGSAYVFSRASGEWRQTAKLVASGGESEDRFGRAVALDGDTAVVGAYGTGPGAGAAYVFSGGESWSQETDLGTAVDLERNDGFGWDVAIDGDTALVGAGGDGQFAGAAYVFARSEGAWTRTARLSGDGDQNDFFGTAVALSGDTALVGSPDDDTNGTDAGAAYAFGGAGGSWTRQSKVTAGDADDNFGESVAVDGDLALVGAFRDEDPNGTFSGSAYAYARAGTTWHRGPKLVAADGDSYDTFGVSVALDDSLGLVGASAADAPAADSAGAAYLFDL